jgi:hypothetical protein
MRSRHVIAALAVAAMGALELTGCSATNEENLGGQTSKVAPRDPNIPDFKSFGEMNQYKTQHAKTGVGAAKGKAAGKAAPKATESETPEEKPK